ncbi:uncharacterized protein LTR77_000537 [Saxophila tyrrhenica]|uniref:Uncharacterized protein n=1 Tax=Saxophila tyrrhenica TaxID=1690608 RepID=A0AAV9PQ75_9PEZI|nr:hypothetical protein LTR77_000537 [Saxophila tyrrhenica]
MSSIHIGIVLDNGCRITHGKGANVKKPFSDIDLTMHELSPSNQNGFRGQLGFIEFTSELRLPRHIHMDAAKERLLDERILVLNGVGLVEIAGEIWATAPGVRLPDGTVSEGQFTMVYEYEEPTSFYPTESTEAITDAAHYQPFQGSNFDDIRFPMLETRQVAKQASIVLDREQHQGLSLA